MALLPDPPAAQEIAAQHTAALDPNTQDGIPPYLRARHAADIARAGPQSAALLCKAFPKTAPW